MPEPTSRGFQSALANYTKKMDAPFGAPIFIGSERGIRTHDTRIMIPLLYRLSYPAIKKHVLNNIYPQLCQ